MRTENSIKGIITSVISNVINIIVSLIAQAVFIKVLGQVYLGINGLFNNILSMLAIVELGFASAIIVNLYKPVANDEREKIKSLLLYYKKIYKIISVVIFLLGMILLPFLKYIVGEVEIKESLQFLFILYLLDIVASYVLTYKRSILYANQKSYIINIVHIGYLIVLNVFQIAYLLIFKNIVGYLLIKIACRLLENIILTMIANKKYAYITDTNVSEIDAETKTDIVTKVKGLFYHRIGFSILTGTDNIVISMTKSLGVIYVGLYSNYNLIFSAIQNLMTLVFSSLTASVGNLLVEDNNEKTYKVFKSLLLFNAWAYTFITISAFYISKPFITIWLGEEYVLSSMVVLVFIVNLFMTGMKKVYVTFKEAAGIFYEDRFVPIIEGLVNIGMSIILVKYFGLAGVFLGTLCSSLVLFIYSFPKFVYEGILKQSRVQYTKELMACIVRFIICFVITEAVMRFVVVSNIWIELGIKIIICLIIPNLLYFLFVRDTNEFAFYKQKFKNILKRG